MLIVRNLALSSLLSLLLLMPATPAQQGGDLQAQILYAYQSEDSNSLANLTQDLTTRVAADGGDAALRYHLAHAQYRSGLLAAGSGAGAQAESAFSDCIDELKPLASQD